MYRLLIVDDEAWIRERLRYTVDWAGMNVEVIGEASDGEEALEVSRRLLPDIVITDIRMPCIDGLEYIKRLKAEDNRAKVVIISGYSDFEYAQKAIKLGAFDYILKPIEDDELIGIVQRCLAEIDSERDKDKLLKAAKEQIKESWPVLKEKFLLNLVNDNFSSEDDIKKELGCLGIQYGYDANICFIIELDELEPKNHIEVWDKYLLQFVMCNIARDFLVKLGNSEVFFAQTGEVICLVFSETDKVVLTRRVLSVSNGIRKMIKKVTGYSVTIGVGRTCSTLAGLSLSCSEAREALRFKGYLGKDRIYDIRSINMEHRPSPYKINDMEMLLNNIKMGNRENATATLDGIVKGIYKGTPDIYPIDLKFLYMGIVNSVFKTIQDANISYDDFFDFTYKFLDQLQRLQTVDEISKWLKDTIVKIIDILEKYKSTKKRKVIEKAVEYINGHYTEPITLNSIADKFFMNASYFCKVFKDEMGESFTKYFINLRIQKAKELMSDPTVKIYEIAGMVGYDDVQYFTRIFKTIVGVTPMQYREKIK